MASLPIYSTYYLNRLIEKLLPQPRFFLDKFFPTEVQSDKEEIYFDEVVGARVGIAPFVHPLVEAPTIREQGYKTKSFKPAYIKEKTGLTAEKGWTRLPGEAFGGEMTPLQRAEMQLMKDTNRLYERIRNRMELMAAEVVKTGKLTIKGEGINALLDYERDASLTKSLTGTKAWTNKDQSMTEFFEGIQRDVAALNLNQSRPRTVLMGHDAYNLFRQNSEVQKLLPDYMRGANLSIEQTPELNQSFSNVIYKGYYGNASIWLHEGKSDDGNFYIDPKQVLFLCDSIQGVRHFGAIQDLDAGLRPQPIFAKSWKIEDPSQRLVLLQSAPLLVTYDPNTASLITVA